MNPINLGNSISTIQWENENELRWYPFEPGSSGSRSSRIVSDLSIMTDDQRSEKFRMWSAHVGPGVVSVSFSDGASAAVCTVPREEFEAYRPYPLLRVSGVCGGMCSFGEVDFDDPFTEKLGGDGPAVLDTVVCRVHIGRLKGFVDDQSGMVATGDVELIFPSDTVVTESEPTPGVGRIEVGLSKSLDGALVSPCDSGDLLYAGKLSPIRSINGVAPDSRGRLAIVFE
jgi:hypothetical protein